MSRAQLSETSHLANSIMYKLNTCFSSPRIFREKSGRVITLSINYFIIEPTISKKDPVLCAG